MLGARFSSLPLQSAACPRLRPVYRKFYATRRTVGESVEQEDHIVAARKWLERFNPESLPMSIFDITFSRASGPGGQNVNKVNSKATLRVGLSALLPHLPVLLHPEISRSRYYAANSQSLIFQADGSRKQNDNTHACFTKLFNEISECGRRVIPGETSLEQRQRVKNLQAAQNQGRLKSKKAHSLKKSSRRGGSSSDF